jgi:hypothetical protein
MMNLHHNIENRLTDQKLKDFHDNGFVVLPQVFPSSYIDELKCEIFNILDNVDESEEQLIKYDPLHRSTNDYFLESGDKVKFEIMI